MPVAQVAKAMGDLASGAHRWVARVDAEGDARIAAARLEHRRGPDRLGPELRVPARTVSAGCAATTCPGGARSTRSPANRYGHTAHDQALRA